MTDRPDDILLTAYALGELDDAHDLARVERWIAEDESAARQADDLRQIAAVLTEGLKGEPDVGLTAIHYAGIERRLAADAASDAHPIPIRRNWAMWGSIAASTLVMATLMAGVLPQVLKSGKTGVGIGGGTANGSGGAGDSGNGSAVSDGSSIGPIGSPVRPAEGGAPAEAAGDPTDWPMLRTSAGGLPWPAVAASDTGLREPSFVVAGDFPLSMIPATPAYPEAALKGTLASAKAALAAGRLPTPTQVRTDELINSIRYDDAPKADGPVSATIESAVCPWDSGHFLVRVVVRTTGKAAGAADAAHNDDAAEPTTAPSIAPLIRDLRLSVEMNPAAVAGYKVIGYENAPRSWGEWASRNDMEIVPAGKTFTVLLEVVPAGTALPAGDQADIPLKYRRANSVVVTATEMLTVGIEYRQGPKAEPVQIDLPTSMEASAIELASPEFRTAAAAAALGQALRHAKPYEVPSLDVSLKLLADVTASAPTADRQILLDLAKRAEAMNPNPKADPNAPMPGPFEEQDGKQPTD